MHNLTYRKQVKTIRCCTETAQYCASIARFVSNSWAF